MIKMKFIVIFALFLISSATQAEEAEGKTFSALTIGAEAVQYRYVEPGLIAHQGYLIGFFAELPWSRPSGFQGLFKGNLLFGQLDYDGGLCDVNTGQCSAYQAKTTDVISRITHRFIFPMPRGFDFFVGPGLRYLYDRGEGSGFYTRTGIYIFAPIGLSFKKDDYSLDLEADIFLKGLMHSKLSEANSTYGDVDHTQSAGFGHILTVSKKITDAKWFQNLIVSIYYESWDVSHSDVVELQVNGSASGKFFIEPKNFTQAFGFRLGVFY